MGGVLLAAQRAIRDVERVEGVSAALVAKLARANTPCLGAKAVSGPEPCHNPALAGLLLPLPAAVGSNVVYRPDCRERGGDELRMCSIGPSSGYVKRVAAIGDSHVAALLPALEVAAGTLGWRIDVATKNACYWTTSTQLGLNAASIENCVRWKERLNRKLSADAAYDAIIVTHRTDAFMPDAAPGETREATIVRGLLESWRTQAERGTRIIAIRDNPHPGAGMVGCVARHLLRANEHCSLPRASALATFDGHLPATQAMPGSHLIDLSDIYCDDTTCPAVIGNVIVYRDDNHITATFARTLGSRLSRELQRILG